MKIALGVMARAPSSPGKTRLATYVPEPRLRALREALLADTLETAFAAPHLDPIVFVTPPGGDVARAFQKDVARAFQAREPIPILPQIEGDLGARMHDALVELIDRRSYGAAMLIGTDAPLLTVEHLEEAAALLRTRGGVVLGPADDGGYYLIGMTKVFPELFEGIEWGSDSVLMDTMRIADAHRIDACLIRGAYDVDTIDDLRRLERDLLVEPLDVARHVRALMVAGSWLLGSNELS